MKSVTHFSCLSRKWLDNYKLIFFKRYKHNAFKLSCFWTPITFSLNTLMKYSPISNTLILKRIKYSFFYQNFEKQPILLFRNYMEAIFFFLFFSTFIKRQILTNYGFNISEIVRQIFFFIFFRNTYDKEIDKI